jgi:hypothetical protein
LPVDVIDQSASFLHVRYGKSFGKPVVDGRQDVSGFVASPPVAPETGEASGCAELPELGILPFCGYQGATKTCFSFYLVAQSCR